MEAQQNPSICSAFPPDVPHHDCVVRQRLRPVVEYWRSSRQADHNGAVPLGPDRAEEAMAQWLLRDVLAFKPGEIDTQLCSKFPVNMG